VHWLAHSGAHIGLERARLLCRYAEPLPVGAAVRLQIHRAGLILDALANVSARHAGSGMGLVFGELTGRRRPSWRLG